MNQKRSMQAFLDGLQKNGIEPRDITCFEKYLHGKGSVNRLIEIYVPIV